jgi:hypothetical protein
MIVQDFILKFPRVAYSNAGNRFGVGYELNTAVENVADFIHPDYMKKLVS